MSAVTWTRYTYILYNVMFLCLEVMYIVAVLQIMWGKATLYSVTLFCM